MPSYFSPGQCHDPIQEHVNREHTLITNVWEWVTTAKRNERAKLASFSVSVCVNASFRFQIPWPFFSRELCRKARTAGANLKGGSEDLQQKRRGNRRKTGP